MANALTRIRKRNPMPGTLWLTIARDDGRERADPALGPARRLRPHRRRRAHGAEPVPGPPRLGRDPRLRDVAPLRARPPRSRRARLARRRAHDDARRPPRGDPGWAPVARPRRRGRPDVRGLPALGPAPAGAVLRRPRGAPLVRSRARRPARARARAPVLLGALTALLALTPAGAALVYVSASVWLLLDGRLTAGGLLLAWGVVAVSMVDNIIRSWFLRGAVRVPFLLGFFGVLGGITAFGAVGIFLGPIAIALLLALWREWAAAA